MTQIAALTLADGQATPANHTFSPTSTKDGVPLWHDRSGGIAVGFPSLSANVRKPTRDNRNYKVTLRLVSPTLEVTSASTATGIQPAPTKAYDCTAFMEFVLPERSTKANRADILAYAKNLLANAVVKAMIEDYEEQY